MGRNYNEIIEQWNLITKPKKCDIKIVEMDLLDTTARGETLTIQLSIVYPEFNQLDIFFINISTIENNI